MDPAEHTASERDASRRSDGLVLPSAVLAAFVLLAFVWLGLGLHATKLSPSAQSARSAQGVIRMAAAPQAASESGAPAPKLAGLKLEQSLHLPASAEAETSARAPSPEIE
jgi:hypothetical protein